MSSRSDIERVLDDYLAEGEEQVPDRVLDAALDQIDHTSQRHAWGMPWRFDLMSTPLKAALGAAVIVLLVVGGVYLTRGTTNVGAPAPATPSPSPAATAVASPSPSVALTDTSNWVAFTSERYGYTMSNPPSWTATPATRDWEFETDHLDFTTSGADHFLDRSSSYRILVTAFAADVPSDMSEDEWINAYYEGDVIEGVTCVNTLEDMQPISVDGHAGQMGINDACSDAQTFVFIDGRVHVFAVWRPDQEKLLEAFLSTVDFQ